MPIAEWCAKLTQCAGGDPQQQIVATHTRVAAVTSSSRGTQDAISTTTVAAEPATQAGEAVAHADEDADGDAETDVDGMLMSAGTVDTRCSSNTNSDDGEILDSARSGRYQQPEGDDDDTMTTSMSRRLSALVQRRPRVPTISVTSLYNKMQTRGVVVVDCRDADDFAQRHLPGALNCAYAKGRKKSMDDVIELSQNKVLAHKLAARDLMEIVVVGANRSNRLYKMDWGYRVARMLLTEGRVYSVRFLAQGFPLFVQKYDFLLQTRPSICVGLPTPLVRSKEPSIQYPNEILDNFLYLGNFWQANSAAVISALQITHVVNMGALTDDRDKLDHVTYYDVEILDRVDVDIHTTFEPTAKYIQKVASESGARVLVHCVQGVSRSASIVIWYIMVTTHCSLSAAYHHVLKCRPLIFPNHGFMQQLIAYETELYGCASVTLEEIDLLQHGLLQSIDRPGSLLPESFV